MTSIHVHKQIFGRDEQSPLPSQKQPSKSSSFNTCSVTDCGKQLSIDSSISVCPSIHTNCLDAMKRHAHNVQCPLCRQSLDSRAKHHGSLVARPPIVPPERHNLHWSILSSSPFFRGDSNVSCWELGVVVTVCTIIVGVVINQWSAIRAVAICHSRIKQRTLNSFYVVSYRLQYDVCLPTTHSAIAVHEYPPSPEPKSSYRFEYESIPLTLKSINTVKLYCALPRPKCILFASHTICAGWSDTWICRTTTRLEWIGTSPGLCPLG